MNKYSKPIAVAVLMLIVVAWFLHNTKSDLPLIFQKDLLAHDESSNSVVAANLTRQFFPPMVRVNPLNNSQGNWMEGPYWQHIPPLFAYVPYPFFKLDGQISIEVKRLSYALITLLTGLLFIVSIYLFSESLLLALAATMAGIFWINTPFTHELITGYAFGASDIILAFTVVCGFAGILWYLKKEKKVRADYPEWKLILIAWLVTLPILAKSTLGAIPAITFFGIFFLDQRKVSIKVSATIAAFLGLLAWYFGSLYLSSPATFRQEIITPLLHASSGYEGWGRPWYFYLTDYLPNHYLFGEALIYWLGLIVATVVLWKWKMTRTSKILLGLSLFWFVWNLVAISVVQSKIPNFIYQSYLFSLFVIAAAPLILLSDGGLDQQIEVWLENKNAKSFINLGLVLVVLFAVVSCYQLFIQLRQQRAQAYSYSSEHEKFYQTGEELRGLGLGTKDLIIIRVSDNDCWFRYYPLFLTGTESKTLLEISFGFDPNVIKKQYSRMYFVMNKNDYSQDVIGGKQVALTNYSALEFDLNQMSVEQISGMIDTFVFTHKADIAQDILRIKKDKTSCQWLVPDAILNAK